MRMAAILRSEPLGGAALVGGWRRRAAVYPDALVATMVARALDPSVLVGWSARVALLARGDRIALAELLVRIARGVLDAVLALNRVHAPHRAPKWQRSLLAQAPTRPEDLARRLDLLVDGPSAAALAEAERLLGEVLDLADAGGVAVTASFRESLRQRRREVRPPSR